MYFRMMPFFCIHISRLKPGGIFKHDFVANLLPRPLVKNFENRIIVGEVMAKSLVSCFLTHGVLQNAVHHFVVKFSKFSSP